MSPLCTDLSREDLVRVLVNKFEKVAINVNQFVPNKLVHVTLEDCAMLTLRTLYFRLLAAVFWVWGLRPGLCLFTSILSRKITTG